MRGSLSTNIAAIATLLALFVPPLMAQTDGPAYVRHVIATVKPDRVMEFESLLEERAAILRDSGRQGFRNVYESVQGDRYTYLIEDPLPSLAALDERRPQMFSRGSSVLSYAEDSFFRFRPDLSFAAD